MFAAQRQEIILRDVRLKGASRVADLAARMDVSDLTIRRDLAVLEKSGLLIRVHGGARVPREGEIPAVESESPPRPTVPATPSSSAGGREAPPPRTSAGGREVPSPRERLERRGERRGEMEPGVAGRRWSRDQPASESLHGKPRAVIGIIVPSSTYYYAAVLRGAKMAARQTSVRLVLGVSSYDSTEERSQIERMMRIGVDALLITPALTSTADIRTYRMLSRLPVPVVMIERAWTTPDLSNQLPYVRTDHDYGARLAVRHLAARGHQRIAVALNSASATTPWILEGYRAEMRAGGLPADLPVLWWDPKHASPELVRAALAEVLQQCLSAQATAVLFHADHDAVGFVHYARDHGVDVPRDLAVVAYDDEIAGLADPPLTAIAPPKEDVGRVAVDQCLQLLCRGDIHATRRTLLLPELVVRESA